MMSMLPALMADDEFRENLDALEIQYQGGYPDMGESTERMAILCDNAYRRINDSSCAAHLPTSIDSTGNVMRVSTTHLDSGSFRPDTVVAGMFTILANSSMPEKLEITPATPHSDLFGKYVLDPTRVSRRSSRDWYLSWRHGMCCPRRWSPSASTPSSPPARRCPCAISFCAALPARERPRVPAPSLRA